MDKKLKVLKVLLTLPILFLALAACLFLTWAYSELLNFFPWGDDNSYVIWEPLVLYFIVPPMILFGCLFIFIGKQGRFQLLGFHLIFIGLGFILPSIIGFDLQTDLKGRWCGVIVSTIATLILMTDIIQSLKVKH